MDLGNNNYVYRILRLPRRYDRTCCSIANYNNLENRKKIIMIKGHYRKGVELTGIVSMRFEKDLFDYIEANRGEINRSKYINDLIRIGIKYERNVV